MAGRRPPQVPGLGAEAGAALAAHAGVDKISFTGSGVRPVAFPPSLLSAVRRLALAYARREISSTPSSFCPLTVSTLVPPLPPVRGARLGLRRPRLAGECGPFARRGATVAVRCPV